MGLKTFIKKQIAGTPEKRFQNQRRKAEDIQFKQELHEAKEKGYRKAALKRAEQEGTRKGEGGGGFSAGLGGNLNALSGAINNTEKMFGFGDTYKMGSNLDFGIGNIGGGQQHSNPKPTSETRVTKNGTVRIIHYGNPNAKKKESQARPYDWMDNIDNPF